MGFAPIEVASSLTKQTEDGSQRGLDSALKQGDHETIDFPTQDLSRFEQAAMWVVPAPLMEKPLLNEHGTDLRIQFTQNPIGLFRAPFIDFAVFLPKAKEALDLPAQAGHDQHFWQGEHAARYIGQEDGPIRQVQNVLRRFTTMSFGILLDLIPPLV